MSLAQGNNTPTRPRIEPGSPDPESAALTTRPVRSPWIEEVVGLYYLCSENKGADQLHSNAQLICGFVFAYAKIGFPHDAAHLCLSWSGTPEMFSHKTLASLSISV